MSARRSVLLVLKVALAVWIGWRILAPLSVMLYHDAARQVHAEAERGSR